MSNEILAEALARLEHKVDLILSALKSTGLIYPSVPMHFPGHTCPVCAHTIDYQIDVNKGVVVRKCRCSTGKLAPTVPLVAIQIGVTDGNAATKQQTPNYPTEGSEESNRR